MSERLLSPPLPNSIKELGNYIPNNFNKRAKVVAATAFFRTPVYQHQAEDYGLDRNDTAIVNQVAKSGQGKKEEILMEVLTKWLSLKKKSGKVWISDTLSIDLNFFMPDKVPESCSILQAFFIGKGVPSFVLTLYTLANDSDCRSQTADADTRTCDSDAIGQHAEPVTQPGDDDTQIGGPPNTQSAGTDTNAANRDANTKTAKRNKLVSEIHDVTVSTVKQLRSALLDFCHCDFAILPCTLEMSSLSVETLTEELKVRQADCQQFYDGPIRVNAATCRILTTATVILQGASWVPCNLQTLERPFPSTKQADDWLLLPEKPWRDLVHHLIETLTHGCPKYPGVISVQSKSKVKVAVLEAARRVGVKEPVKIITSDEDVIACVKKLQNQSKDKQGMDLRVEASSAGEECASLIVSTQHADVHFEYVDVDDTGADFSVVNLSLRVRRSLQFDAAETPHGTCNFNSHGVRKVHSMPQMLPPQAEVGPSVLPDL